MSRILGILSFLFLAASQLPAQAYVQISALRARNEVLSCVGLGATTSIRLQIYLAGLPADAKTMTGIVQLAAYSARPSVNKVEIREASRDFTLTESPALVDFEVNCTGDTRPGEIVLAATISAVPEGILIKEPTAEPLVHIRIAPSR